MHKRGKIEVTKGEVRAAEAGYKNKCDFCERRFKTKRGMLIHRARCVMNYNTTDEVYILDDITGVFGHKDARWFKVKWRGHEEEEWEREHLLVRDGCMTSIRNFWATSGLQPAKDFYADPENEHRCTICTKTFSRAQDLKDHRTRQGHHDHKKKKKTMTAYADAILQKRRDEQEKLQKVKWSDTEAGNAWLFKYLGSIFEAGGGCMTDVRRRIAMARQRFGKMRHIWANKELHQKLRMTLYKASVCSILTYGSEAWKLNAEVAKAINGVNAQMVCVITGKTPHQEHGIRRHHKSGALST